MESLVPIVGSGIAIVLTDLSWLTLNRKYYEDLFGAIQGSKLEIRWIPALLIYILIPVTVYFFAVKDAKNLQSATLRGAALGFSIYAVYDLTNYATFTKYTLRMAATDVVWGTVLCAIGASVGFILSKY